MSSLNHPYIVELYGICVSNPLRLVMEIASLSPLNKFLRKHQSLTANKVMNMIVEVSQGMEYLEQKRFVHRDLATRNVLVVSEDMVKISDFGMPRPAGNTTGLRQLADVLLNGMFPSASSLQSFAASLTFGASEWLHGMDSRLVLDHTQGIKVKTSCKCWRTTSSDWTNRRDVYPPSVYEVMLHCLSWRPEDRPTFAELSSILRDIHSYILREEPRSSMPKEEVRSPPVCPPRRPIPPPKNT